MYISTMRCTDKETSMAISLKKNETLSLRKDNSALSAVSLGYSYFSF